jgi:hypothetical protein
MLKIELSHDIAILFLGVNSKESKTAYNSIPMFIAALNTSYGISLIDEWIKEM